MLSRSLVSKFKCYSQALQALKNNDFLPTGPLLRNREMRFSMKHVKYVEYMQFAKDYIAKTRYRQRYENAISALQNVLGQKSVSNIKEDTQDYTRIQDLSDDLKITTKLYSNEPKSNNKQYIKLERKLRNILNTNLAACANRSEAILSKLKQHRYLLCSTAGVAAVPTDGANTSPVIEWIPEPPAVPETEIISQVNALGEPTLESLGIGGWSPVGIVQNCLEYLHVSFGMPWWETIVIGTVVVRILMFPLVIIAQRNAARMNNYLPQLQILQLKMSEARQTGNQLEVARYGQEMMIFMKEKGLNPFKNMLVPLAQMPVFLSFFIGLRKMANVPVESLREGGMLWFTDLTVPDQYFALPIITSLTLWATIELGTDSAKLSSQNLQTMKYVLRALPVIILPFTVNFPGVILCYWVSSNFISLMQVGFLKIPSVRDYFKIEAIIKHNPENLPVKNKGFVGGIKDSWTNIKITKEIEERRRYDELQFQRAGKGPVVKTYKYDPTKQVKVGDAANAMSAKKR